MDLYEYALRGARRARQAKNSLTNAAGKWVEDAKQNVSNAVTVAGVLAQVAVSGAVSNVPGPVAQLAETYVSGATSSTATSVATAGLVGVGVPLPAAAVLGAGVGGGTAVLSELASQVAEEAGVAGETDTEKVFLSQQCFLIYNVDSFSKFHQKLLSRDTSPAMPTPSFYSSLSTTNDIDTGGYFGKSVPRQKIYLTSTEDSSFLFNRFSVKRHGDRFANIKTPEIAQLVPRLRIYKVYREDGQATDKKVEFEFAAGSNTDFYTAPQNTQPFPNAPKEFVRGMDVGVESFSWRFIGDDPFMATRFVEAELKLTGQTMQAFFYQRTSNNTLPQGTKGQYRYLDLILQPDCRRNRTNSLVYQTYSPECYEVQVEVGYNGSNKNFGTFADDGQFREAIDAQTEILRLGVQEHKFDFKEDGSVGLTIKFKGFLELFAKDKSMNVLLPYGGMANGSIKVDLSDISPSIINKFGTPHLVSSWNKTSGLATLLEAEDLLTALQNEKETDEIKEAKEKIETKISNIFVSSKQALMSHILNRLETSNAVYTYIMSGEEERSFNNPGENNFSPPAKVKLNKVIEGGHGRLFGLGRLDDATSDTGEASGRRISLELAANNQESLNNIIDSGLTNSFIDNSLSNFLGRNRLISYFFIGDLIAVILDSIAGDNTFTFSDQNFYFSDLPLGGLLQDTLATGIQLAEAIAPVEGQTSSALLSGERSIDTTTVGQVLNQIRVILGNVKFRLKGDQSDTVVNIANIPVTVQSFNQFMIENVLSKDVENYSFFEFIDDLIKALVTDFLGSKCFGGLIEFSANPQAAVFSSSKELRVQGLKTFYVPEGASSVAKYNVIHPSKIKKTSPLFNTTTISQADKIYFVFNIISTDDSEMNGDYDVDNEAGIIHLAHGIHRGLVKNMSFEKVNQEFVAEAVFVNPGGTILSQLANKFDVTIEMVGNNLFRNGQYIYINAESFGGGPSYYDKGEGEDRQRSWANIMGLGGYHIITAVDNTISADGTFKTTLKARWETGGKLPPGNNP